MSYFHTSSEIGCATQAFFHWLPGMYSTVTSSMTTSTVTVPLVTAMGVGLATVIRGRNPLTDGFGLIAFASLTPIIFVLAYGMVV